MARASHQRRRATALAVCAALCCGCVVDELSFEGRTCTADDPCGGGLVCQAGRCVGDDAAAPDVALDAQDGSVDADSAPDGRVDPPPAGTHVSKDGWGHRAPMPLGVRFEGVWFDATSNTTWVVGELGLAARYDGTQWKTFHTGATERLNAVWAPPGALQVWAVGAEGSVVELDPASGKWRFSYSAQKSGQSLPLFDVVGFGNNVYVAAAEGTIVQRHGFVWALAPVGGARPDAYRAITAADSGLIIAVGDAGAVAVGEPAGSSATVWNGHNVEGAQPPNFSDVASVGMQVWAVSSDATGRLYSAALKAKTLPDELGKELATTTSTVAPNLRLRAVAARAADDIWAAGATTFYHWDGMAWTRAKVPQDVELSKNNLVDLALAKPGVRACGAGGLVLQAPSPDSAALLTDLPRERLLAVHRNSSGGVISVGEAGGVFIGTQMAARSSGPLRGVWSARPGETWIVGAGGTKLAHFDGANVTRVTSFGGKAAPRLWAISGAGSAVWAVGAGVWRRDPTSGVWSRESSVDQGEVWRGVYAVSEKDVWVVGTQGKIVHYDGTTWKTVDASTTISLEAVWANAAGQVWVVGGGGYVASSSLAAPMTWQKHAVPASATYFAVQGRSATDIWVAGTAGIIVHWDGNAWALQQSDTTQTLRGIAVGVGPSDVTIVGDAGTLLHYDDRSGP